MLQWRPSKRGSIVSGRLLCRSISGVWLIRTRHLVLYACKLLSEQLYLTAMQVIQPNTYLPLPCPLSFHARDTAQRIPHALLLPRAHGKVERLWRLKHEHDRAPWTEHAHLLRERERLVIEQGRCGRVEGGRPWTLVQSSQRRVD